jgi:hypothetical protein
MASSYNYVSNRGLVIPDTATTRAQVEAEWREAFGQDLDVSPDTPQGVLITAEVEARDAVARNNAEVANQINPDISGGVWLDAIWALTGGQRRGATASFLPSVELTGQPGTLIPAGSEAVVQASRERFRTLAPVTLDGAGEATVDMRAVTLGPVACPVGALDTIATTVLGWETVNNPVAAIIGTSQESDFASRQRRRNTLALQGISTPQAVTSRLYAVKGVQSLVFRENILPTTETIDGITLAPHSLYACVSGGDDADIAQALLETKTVGAAWNGAVLVNVIEPNSGQVYPVRFDRPTPVLIYVRVTVRATPLDADSLVRNAIINYANGQSDGEPGFAVGEDVSPFELAGAINQLEPRLFVAKVELSSDGGLTYSTADVPISITQVAAVTSGTISVVVV